jgi:ABC-type multidrug transport system ATPase subunit
MDENDTKALASVVYGAEALDEMDAEAVDGSFLTNMSAKAGLTISFEDIAMTLKTKEKTKEILRNLSGQVKKGRFTALLGPTGSGKTSLLNLLAGRTRAVAGMTIAGQVSVGGQVVANWSTYRREVAYVEQDDLLFSNLSVRETLQLAAEFRLPREFTTQERTERVDAVLAELGLIKCQHTYIGSARVRGISGGERKRASVAISILKGPSCVLLDECTSGLDSFQALRVCTTIKRLAAAGRTVVSSIHQPRSAIFALFDDVIVLSEGSIMFAGAAQDMTAHFAKFGFVMPRDFNPADFVLDLVSLDVRTALLEERTRTRVAKLEASFRTSFAMAVVPEGQVLEEISQAHKYEAPYYKQCLLLARRAFSQKLRDKAQLLVPLCVNALFGTLLGIVYFKTGDNLSQTAISDKSGLLFFISLNLFFQGIFSVIATFSLERDIVNRERASKSYSVLPYFFSKVLADIPGLIFRAFAGAALSPVLN